MKKGVSFDVQACREVMDRAEVLHLALQTEDGPYSVPVNFALEGEVIYIHSSYRGTKADALRNAPGCHFSAVSETELRPSDRACSFGYSFRSVMGRGTARFVEGADKLTGLNAIMRKYAGSDEFPYDEKALEKTAVIAIDVTQMTARSKGS